MNRLDLLEGQLHAAHVRAYLAKINESFSGVDLNELVRRARISATIRMKALNNRELKQAHEK